ncbi:hypothetical protein HPB50_009117 [Hyalomma asiaticum]|uniref:Uncharacterized protein n=1 Tax=Hyalomma asiaticum TaxID=266040 RepID=A0ACB7TF83_HYAAI|nr:hypothetical protein HPB50_009117 [Hyalomma asiaticum]
MAAASAVALDEVRKEAAATVLDLFVAGQSAYVLTDSQETCGLYLRGVMPTCVLRILGASHRTMSSPGVRHTPEWTATSGRTAWLKA